MHNIGSSQLINRSAGLDLEAFFREEGIDVFSEVPLCDLPHEDQDYIVRNFRNAQSVIVFAREVPAQVYLLPPKQKTAGMLQIAESLDRSAARLAGMLNSEQVPALSVPLYLPVNMVDGRISGQVRLKYIAAAGRLGSMGMSSVLISRRYGPRLLFSGVVAGRPVSEHLNSEGPAGTGPDITKLCTGCERCIRICPGGAIGPGGVDPFRCRTISTWIPQPLVPVVKFLIGRKFLLKSIAPLAPWIARTATIRCSLCVTECPKFGGEKESGTSAP